VSGRRRTLLLLLIASGVHRVDAQQGPALRRNHLTVSAGLVSNAGYRTGDRTADLRPNAAGTPAPTALFRAESRLNGVAGFEGRIGYALSGALAVEIGGTYTKPQLGITIVEDREVNGEVFVSEEVSQYTVDVSGVLQVPRITLGRRARPYMVGGGGYLRQLHEDRLLVETGSTFHLGGGVRYWLRGGSPRSSALGLRAEARFVRRWRAIEFEDKGRGYATLSVLGFVGF
jgi:hypothetical protein